MPTFTSDTSTLWGAGNTQDQNCDLGVVHEVDATNPGSYSIGFKMAYFEGVVNTVPGASISMNNVPGQVNGGGTAVTYAGANANYNLQNGSTLDFAGAWSPTDAIYLQTVTGNGTFATDNGVAMNISCDNVLTFQNNGFVGSITGSVRLHNYSNNDTGTWDLTGITLNPTTYSNLYQKNGYTGNGNASHYFLAAGDLSANSTATVKNVTLTGRGNMLACSSCVYSNWGLAGSTATTIALDGATVNMSQLTVDGNLAFTGAPSTMTMSVTGKGGVAGTDYSNLVVETLRWDDGQGGTTVSNSGGQLSGLGNVNLVISLTPGLALTGQTLTIVSSANGAALPAFNSVKWVGGGGDVNYNGDGTITLTGVTSLAGDINGDGLVDVADYNIWAANVGKTGATWSQGDLNGDGLVDVADYNIWAANVGKTAATPEPISMIILAIGGGLVALKRRNG